MSSLACRSYQVLIWSKPHHWRTSLHALSCDHQTYGINLSGSCHACCNAANTFNLNHLHSGSVSRQRYSLSVALHSCSHGLAEVHVRMIWTVDPGIYGSWVVSPSINTCVHNAVSLVQGLLRLTPIIVLVGSFEEYTVKLGIDIKHYPLVISDNKNTHTHTHTRTHTHTHTQKIKNKKNSDSAED